VSTATQVHRFDSTVTRWWPQSSIKVFYRPRLSQEALLLLASLIATVGGNAMFWHALLANRSLTDPHTWQVGGGTLLLIVAIHFVLFALPSGRWTIKPVLILLALVSAAAATYMQQYTVYFDTNMLRNVLHTQVGEARELVTLSMLTKVLAMAALPVAIILWVKVTKRSWRRALGMRVAAFMAALVFATVGGLLAAQDLSSLLRNHKEARYLVTPANLIVAGLRVAGSDARAAASVRLAVGEDARQRVLAGNQRPLLLVLVVGETVRAENWGLNGYQRQTTPNLSQLDVINFPDVTACGTSTEVSLPCMFSETGRRDYDEERIRNSDSLLHVVSRAGISTLWIDNQTGCKGVCTGLAFESIRGDEDPALCDGEVCLDQVLVDRVRGFLASGEGAVDAVSDQIIVLHPLGNHGPSYSRRYPAAFRRFVPTCEKADLSACSMEEIGNSYDNAIGYTDHLLAELIGMLDRQSTYDAALLYVSDHGESLGERGLYLHGLPYSLAPSEQLKVPMALWTSDALTSSMVVDQACLRQESRQSLTHDNVFHSVMGLFDVSSVVYAPELDLLARCRSATPAGSLAGRGGAALLAPRAAQVRVADSGQQGR